MRPHPATVIANLALGPGLQRLELDAPALARAARPGQFVMARCCGPGPALDPPLRRPLALHAIDPAAGTVALLVAPRGRGTAWLAAAPPGQTLDLLGPLGRPWEPPARVRSLLLAAAGPHVAALLAPLEAAAARGLGVALAHEAPAVADLYPAPLLPAEVELLLCAGDGGASEPRDMAALLARSPAVEWADALVLAGPRAWLRDIAAAHPRLGARGFAQAASWTPLPCGTGLCGACAFETRRGWRLACKDGPFFPLGDLLG